MAPRRIQILLLAVLSASCSASAETFAPSDFVRVGCSSKDGGETCYAYGEYYSDGTSDSCGRVPGGAEFALTTTYTVEGNTVCETVTTTSDARVMPVGERFCSLFLDRTPRALTYRFTDDPPDTLRHSYAAKRSDVWCRHLIDALQ